MSLAVDVTHRFGSFLLEARFVSDGRLTAFFGRSGSGKTSLINIIAGVVRPDRGRIVLDDTALVDTDRGLFVPKYRRRVGYVFQEGRLFPHLTVRQNLLFGRWFTPPRERHVTLDQVLDLLDIGQLLDRRPGGLSGGEKQRVAIGRALLTSPRLLLMDEPLASLDDSRKDEILPFIERLRDEARVPIVYVSHSLPEVARLATTVVVFQDGRIMATGSPTDVLGRADVLAPYVVVRSRSPDRGDGLRARPRLRPDRAAIARRIIPGAAPRSSDRNAGSHTRSRPRRDDRHRASRWPERAQRTVRRRPRAGRDRGRPG